MTEEEIDAEMKRFDQLIVKSFENSGCCINCTYGCPKVSGCDCGCHLKGGINYD